MRHAAQVAAGLGIAISLLIAANQHGKPRTGKWSFWAELLGDTGWAILLWYGGFWRW